MVSGWSKNDMPKACQIMNIHRAQHVSPAALLAQTCWPLPRDQSAIGRISTPGFAPSEFGAFLKPLRISIGFSASLSSLCPCDDPEVRRAKSRCATQSVGGPARLRTDRCMVQSTWHASQDTWSNACCCTCDESHGSHCCM